MQILTSTCAEVPFLVQFETLSQFTPATLLKLISFCRYFAKILTRSTEQLFRFSRFQCNSGWKLQSKWDWVSHFIVFFYYVVFYQLKYFCCFLKDLRKFSDSFVHSFYNYICLLTAVLQASTSISTNLMKS